MKFRDQSFKILCKKLFLGVESFFYPRLKILAYHGIEKDSPDLYDVTKKSFYDQMHFLKEEGYHVLSLDTAIEQLFNNRLQKKSIVVTFDDGYLSVIENGYSILADLKFSATIFIPTVSVGGLHEQKKCLTWDQIKYFEGNGFDFQPHSVNHVDLTVLNQNDLEFEILYSYEILRGHIGEKNYYFAYPFGLLNKPVRDLIEKAPYSGALCFGSVLSNWFKTDRYLLKREKILATTTLDEFKKIANPKYDIGRAILAFLKKI